MRSAPPLHLGHQFARFAACGAVGTLAHYALLVALVDGLGAGAVIASSAGFGLGAIVNYALNYRFTFRSTRPHLDAGVRFMTVALLGAGVNAALMALLTGTLQLHYLAAQLLATVTVLGWNFLADRTLAVLEALQREDSCITLIDLSRNFGKEIAITAGLDHARGEAVVVIDADLQDPPELIPELFARWRDGADVVYAQRTGRDGESWLKRSTAAGFYRLAGRLGGVSIPRDTGDFRLVGRRALDALRSVRERRRFMKGLFAWIGFRQEAVAYRRAARHAGRTKWNYWQLWNLAIEGITSFTTTPLKIATYLGLSVSLAAFCYAAVVIYKTLAFGEPVRGYPSLMVVILFLGGVQLAALGVIGEYLARMFDETKQRPLYFINRIARADPSAAGAVRATVTPAES